MGGASAPMPCAQVAVIRDKSIGAEAPPTRAKGIGAKTFRQESASPGLRANENFSFRREKN
ncbi:DUF6053 domain-containing protein [Lysobacter enzymogenes]|uniref:DUF6053 domain-containing protein n=1 Tax=Lysobacter enzymogenes TaxID=69 RepID=UPI00374830DF